MNNTRKRNIVEGLTAAKHFLAHSLKECNTKEEFICNALEKAWSNGNVEYECVIHPQDLIMQRLSPYTTAEQWLLVRLGVKSIDRDALQVWRHDWVDMLIKEFA